MKSEESCVKLVLKVCPICKTHVFDDMDVCYNCMYSFGSNPALEHKVGNGDGNRNSEVAKAEVELCKAELCKAEVIPARDPDESMLVNVAASANMEGSLLSPSVHFETPEDCIREYETMFIFRERGTVKSDAPNASSAHALPASMKSEGLLDEFLIEFGGFLRKFLLDREIRI